MNFKGYELLGNTVGQRRKEFNLIEEERKRLLVKLATEIRRTLFTECSADLIFICTHNSRRSHLAQLWAQLASEYYEVTGIRCFSGGTEATAANPMAVKTLEQAGFIIEQMDDSENPEYLIRFPGEDEGITVFSKQYGDPPNPTNDFIAAMTCSDADEACPIVEGASSRHSIHYQDPKVYDGTPEEMARYAERSNQIAREMFFLFSLV